MNKKRVHLVIILALVLISLVGCKGILDEEEFKGKSLGVIIILPETINVNDSEQVFSDTYRNQLSSGIIAQIKDKVDMEVVDLHSGLSSVQADYRLTIEVNNIEWYDELVSEDKTVTEIISEEEDIKFTRTEPVYKNNIICEVNTNYKLVNTENNEELSTESKDTSIDITEDKEYTEIDEYRLYVAEQGMEDRSGIIQRAIMRSLREIVGY